LPKEGGRFDLPIALGILAASGQINRERLAQYEFFGELALGGELRGIRGVLPAALACRDAGRTLLVPRDNAGEARWSAARRCWAQDICWRSADNWRPARPATAGHAAPAPLEAMLERDLAMCAASSTPSARWKSPRPAVITCC
jgi:magnesium chelatase family protein